jgi:hypothetical protein
VWRDKERYQNAVFQRLSDICQSFVGDSAVNVGPAGEFKVHEKVVKGIIPWSGRDGGGDLRGFVSPDKELNIRC